MIDKYPNLIISRSLSKAWGLAGLRVGYLISNKDNISLLRRQKPMHEINQLSINVCNKILPYSNEIIKKNIDQVKKWKKIFKNNSTNNLEYLPTEGNYILLKSNSYKYHKDILIKNKIIPKMDFSTPCLKNCFRFSIGKDTTMDKLYSILLK